MLTSEGKFWACVGINPGYGHNNEACVDEFINKLERLGGMGCIYCRIIYPHHFGCPENGEDGIFFYMDSSHDFEKIRLAFQ